MKKVLIILNSFLFLSVMCGSLLAEPIILIRREEPILNGDTPRQMPVEVDTKKSGEVAIAFEKTVESANVAVAKTFSRALLVNETIVNTDAEVFEADLESGNNYTLTIEIDEVVYSGEFYVE